MKDINTRLCELLGCDVPRPKDTYPLCGKTNTDGKMTRRYAKRSVPVMTRVLEWRGKTTENKERKVENGIV